MNANDLMGYSKWCDRNQGLCGVRRGSRTCKRCPLRRVSARVAGDESIGQRVRVGKLRGRQARAQRQETPGS